MTTKKEIMLSALTPSAKPTLGNYIGAIGNWAKMAGDFDCLFFVVDLHGMTSRQDPALLRENTYLAVANFIASGLDPNKLTLFVQSHVSAHAELSWMLTCFSYMGELSRMTQFKDKSSKQGQNITAGLFSYPVLMASDILLYQTQRVPVGEDQKQHIELTRDLAIRMNGLYGGDLFTVPEPWIAPLGSKIMSLQDPTSKMSKSDPDPHATVFLMDEDDVILKKFKRAVTDSGSEVTYDELKPGVKNLLTIQAALTQKSAQEITKTYQGKMYGHLKAETAEIVSASIKPIREESKRLLKDLGYLNQILKMGAEKALPRAHETLKKVYGRVGFIV